jgi:hypothetical protein
MSQRLRQKKAQGGQTGAAAKSMDGLPSAGVRESDVEAHGPFDACREIDHLLDRLSRLTTSELAPEKFLDQLLVEAVREAAAIGGAIWAGRDCLMERFSHTAQAMASLATRNAGRCNLVERVISLGVADKSIIEQANTDGSPGRLLSIVAPFPVESNGQGSIELLLPVASPPQAQDHAMRLAEAFAELIGDYYTRRQIVGFRHREEHWQSLSRFLEAIHRPGLRDAAIAIANEGRWFCRSDRVSVLCLQKATCKALAVSGVDHVERRSNLVARMEELADAVLKTNEPLWHIGTSPPPVPQFEGTLQNYLEQSHSSALVALPLTNRASGTATNNDPAARTELESCALGVLVLEWFAPPVIDDAARQRIELVARHSATALSVALATERLPLIAVNRALAKVTWLAGARQLPRVLWIAGFLAVLLLALIVVPCDFEITADGQLQPLERREIFAPSDAVVDGVLVEHGDEVAAGQPLLRLRSAPLDFESARLRGEIQTAEKRLAAIRSARFEPDKDQSAPAHRRLELTAEEEELKASLSSLQRQEQLLVEERALLDVRSPLDGRVLTWDVARSLAARPVERGQPLLSVGNVGGLWSVELCVPDEQIGYVLDSAEQVRGDGLSMPVSFLLVAEPGVEYSGFIERIARRGHVDEKSGKAVVQVVVRLDDPIENPRPGASVVGKIHCGRHSLGFVWLHDAWNNIRRRLLF